jgi:hypothetical protein
MNAAATLESSHDPILKRGENVIELVQPARGVLALLRGEIWTCRARHGIGLAHDLIGALRPAGDDFGFGV